MNKNVFKTLKGVAKTSLQVLDTTVQVFRCYSTDF